MHDETRQPTEEELQAAFEEQMRQIRVEDVILQTVATLVNLAGRRLGLTGDQEEKDLQQAKLGIDAARVLAPLCPQEQVEPIKQAMAQLQMAYAKETSASQTPVPSPQSPGAQDETPQPDGGEREKARSKIWTPPGA